MSTAQSSPDSGASWLQMRPLDCAFLALALAAPQGHNLQVQTAPWEDRVPECWDFAIANPPWKRNSSGRAKKIQSQQEVCWEHQTSDRDLPFIRKIPQWLIQLSSPRVKPDLPKTGWYIMSLRGIAGILRKSLCIVQVQVLTFTYQTL